jgi:hypothetical protein
MIHKTAHFALVTAGFGAWAVAMACMTVATAFAVWADKVMPNSTKGNCWSFALPRWWRQGGYLLVRAADGQALLKKLPVPHVAWIKHLGEDSRLEFFMPVARKSKTWLPWHVVYYEGRVRTSEKPHDARDA